MAVVVEIGFIETRTYPGTAFVLDESHLDDTGIHLGGYGWADVSQYATSIDIKRGRSRSIDRFEAGTCSVTLRNESRVFDPSWTLGPYYGGIAVRCPLRVTVDGYMLFYGYIDAWDHAWDVPHFSEVTVSASDGLAVLAASTIDQYTPAAERSGTRVRHILSLREINFPDGPERRSINAGRATLGAYAIDQGTTAGDYLQDVALAEGGKLFVDRTGRVCFRQRDTSTTFTYDNLCIGGAVVDVGPFSVGVVPAQKLEPVFSAERWFNRCTVTRVGSSSPQTAEDLDQRSAYLTSSLDITDCLLSTDAQCLTLANYYLGKFGSLNTSYSLQLLSGTVNVNRLTADQKNLVLSTDLDSGVAYAAPVADGAGGYEDYFGGIGHVDSLEHAINASDNTHWVKIGFSDDAREAALILGDPIFGILGYAHLG